MTRNDEFAVFVAAIMQSLSVGTNGDPTGVTPHQALAVAGTLRRYARTLSRLAVRECNDGLTAQEQARKTRTQRNAAAFAALYDMAVKVDGDPRGYVLKVLLPTGLYNTMGGASEGWGVPT